MLEACLKEPIESGWRWCEENIFLNSEVSPNRSGAFVAAPWQREILDCFLIDKNNIESLYMCFGAQTGKSLTALLGICILIENSGLPILVTAPTEALALRYSKSRLRPLLMSNEVTAKHLPLKWQETATQIKLDNCDIYLTGARRPSKIASLSTAICVNDEVAKYEHVDKTEAHPLTLIEERQKSFPRHLTINVSTPSIESNVFWQGFAQTDMRKYFVECPHCQAKQTLEFENVIWDNPRTGEKQTAEHVEETARYVCPNCHETITQSEIREAMESGEWRATNPDAPSQKVGFWLNSLYSPFVTVSQMARKFWEASHSGRGDKDSNLQNFTNSWLAKPWQKTDFAVLDDDIKQLCRPYKKGQIPFAPEDFLYLSTCYDWGQKQSHYVTVAVGKNNVGKHPIMAVVDYGSVLTAQDILPHFRSSGYMLGNELVTPQIGYVDSGDNTQEIYDLCLESGGQLLPTKGTTANFGSWGSRQLTKTHNGLTLITYRDFSLKTFIYYSHIKERVRPLWLPEDITQDFIDGIGGQEVVRNPRTGAPQFKNRRSDHFGDALKLNSLFMWTMANEIAEMCGEQVNRL